MGFIQLIQNRVPIDPNGLSKIITRISLFDEHSVSNKKHSNRFGFFGIQADNEIFASERSDSI